MSRESKISVITSPVSPDDPPEDEVRMQINLRLRFDELADVEAGHLRQKKRRTPQHTELCELACRIYESRRTRDKMIDRNLFGEPAWDMLLALFFFPWRQELLTVTSLSYAANVPQTTGLRWQRILTEEGLIERGPQGIDQRKQFIALTDDGKRMMSEYLTHLFYCDAPIARQVDFSAG